MVVLLVLDEVPGGMREDSYLGVFETPEAAREFLLTQCIVESPLIWRTLHPESGAFSSHSLYGVKPATALRATHTTTQDFAILEF